MKVSSIVNIHLRPEIHKLLENELPSRVFINFCKNNYAGESIECFLMMEEYKKLLKEILPPFLIPEKQLTVDGWGNDLRPLQNSLQQEYLTQNNLQQEEILHIIEENIQNNNTTTTLQNITNNLQDTNTLQNNNLDKILKLLQKINTTFILETSEHTINIDSKTRTSTEQNIYNFTNLTTLQKINLFIDVEFQILLMLTSDVLPRFVRSQKWHEFIQKNTEIATKCCSLEDLELLKKLKYTKKDLKRNIVTIKDLQFSEMVCLDYSCFEYLASNKDINVYFCSGDTFFEESLNNHLGKSNIAKTIGYLPFSAEVVISTMMDELAVQKVYPTTIHDKNELNESSTILRDIPFNIEEMVNHLNLDELPSIFAKYHVNIGNLFNLRTCYTTASGIYLNNKYYYIVKGIYDPKRNLNEYIYYKNGKKFCKSTVTMVSISIHVVTPISKDKCHFIHFASGNLGGIFTKISTTGLFKKFLGKVSIKSRETLISVLNEFKEEKYINIKKGYERAKRSFEIYNRVHGVKEKCPFPETFEELQEFF
ncbi:hypothetical protein ABK040_007351 [Willaertia magna]